MPFYRCICEKKKEMPTVNPASDFGSVELYGISIIIDYFEGEG